MMDNPDLNLTVDQQAQVEKLLDSRQKEMIQHRADQEILRLELKDLIRSDASQSKINKVIDKMQDGRSQMLKQKTQTTMEIRKLLTNEQKVIMNRMSRHGGPGMREHRGEPGMRGHHGKCGGDGFREGRGMRHGRS